MDTNTHAVADGVSGRVVTRRPLAGPRRALAAAGLLVAACMSVPLGGCSKANYAVDLRNQTPQPVYAQLLERMNSGEQRVRLGARLGPGDRAAVGPVRAKTGSMSVLVDTLPNPGAPATLDLPPGTTIVEVTQEGNAASGTIHLRQVR